MPDVEWIAAPTSANPFVSFVPSCQLRSRIGTGKNEGDEEVIIRAIRGLSSCCVLQSAGELASIIPPVPKPRQGVCHGLCRRAPLGLFPNQSAPRLSIRTVQERLDPKDIRTTIMTS